MFPRVQLFDRWGRPVDQFGRVLFPNGMPGYGVRSAGDLDVVSGGDLDVIGLDASTIGAEMIAGADADAQMLLAGLDASTIGAEMISGEDFEVGAARPRRVPRFPLGPNLSQLAHAARVQKAMQAQPVITEKPYTKGRTVPLGIDSTTEIAAGNAQILNVIPNGPYRADNLIIPDDVAPDFVIYLLFFGRVNGLGGASEIPASTYLDNGGASVSRFDCGTVAPGIPIQVGVRNISGAPRRFRGRFQGVILES